LLSVSVRQDELTVQVPTTLPPQAVPFEQEDPPPVPLEAPPVPVVPPVLELPPVPDEPRELELQAPEIIANARVIVRKADWTFIEGLLPRGNL